MDYCSKCVTDKTKCNKCTKNPKYSFISTLKNYYIPYVPTCPYGHTDCVSDPAYIKHYDPEWFKELYEDNEDYPIECNKYYEENPEYCCYYDDEDK